MRRLASALSLAAIISMAATAQAKSPCFTEAEQRAELAIRLHTELMVIGLTCQASDAPGQPSLYARYREFTSRHQDAVRGWEKALIGHFRRVGKGNAARNFDSYRTSLANEASRRAIALSTPVYCSTYVPLAEAALIRPPAELAVALERDAAVWQVASLPRCDTPPARQVAQGSAPAPTAKPATKAVTTAPAHPVR